jgi:hypothetical protein
MFRIRPENKTNIQKGSNFSLQCEAYSKPRLSINYKWLHEGEELSETGMTYTVSKSRVSNVSLIFKTLSTLARFLNSLYIHMGSWKQNETFLERTFF